MTDLGPVLSDVHIECESLTEESYAVTRFKFHLQLPDKQPLTDLECLPTDDLQKCECIKNISSKYIDKNYDASSQLETGVENSLQYDSDGDLILERPQEQCYEDIEPVQKKCKIVDTERHQPESENKETVECNEKIENEEAEESCYSHVGHSSSENVTDGSNKLDNDDDDDDMTDNIRHSYECKPESSQYKSDYFYDVLEEHSPEPVTDKCPCTTNSGVLPTLQNCKDCISYNEIFFINIKHSLATNLQDVGQQVWHGALLLSDFLLYRADLLSGKTVVDLGAGVGLTSIIAAMYANMVYSTDTGDKVLSLNEDNIVSAKTCPTLPHSLCQILVKDIDWFQGLEVKQTSFGLSSDDVECIKKCDVLLAADVIYDFDIIDAFFNTVRQIMDHPPGKTLYISLEKRLVFSAEDLKITSPAYNYFRLLLDELETETSDCHVEYKVTSLDTSFKQYFQYNKSKYLELWCISSTITNS